VAIVAGPPLHEQYSGPWLYLLLLPRKAEKLKTIEALSSHSSSVTPSMIPIDPGGSIPHFHGAASLTASPPFGFVIHNVLRSVSTGIFAVR
jgi:hypothetical protein